MTIAVTGSTGQLGTLTISALLEAGVPAGEIVALARDTAKAADLAERGVAVRSFDYDAPETLAPALEGVEKLLLISGNAVGQRYAQHRAVIDAAVAAQVPVIFYTSVEAGAAGPADSINPVSPEHAQTEAYLGQVGIDHVILRNGWYNENYLGQLSTAPASGSVLTSAGQGRVASASRADFAAAAAAALTAASPRPLYRLTGDVAWGFQDLAADLSQVLGTEIGLANVTGTEQADILAGAGLDAGTVGFVVAADAAIAAGELGATTGELAALIGRPSTPLIDTLRAGV